MEHRKVPADGPDTMLLAAKILEAVNETKHLRTWDEQAERESFLDSLVSGERVRAAMDPLCARAMVDALREWAWLGKVDADVLNRVGGFQMYQLADRIVTGGSK